MKTQMIKLIVGICFLVCSCVTTPPPPPLAVEPSSPESGLTIKQVLGAVQPKQKQAQECFETALKSYRSLQGKLYYELEITPTGDLRESAIIRDDMSMKVPPFEHCLSEVFRSIKFPAPKGGATVKVSYLSLNFKPK